MSKKEILDALDAMIAALDRRNGQTEHSNGQTETEGFYRVQTDFGRLGRLPDAEIGPSRETQSHHEKVSTDNANASDDSRVESFLLKVKGQNGQTRAESLWHLAHGERVPPNLLAEARAHRDELAALLASRNVEALAPATAVDRDDEARGGLSDAECSRLAARIGQVLARENAATSARLQQRQPDKGPNPKADGQRSAASPLTYGETTVVAIRRRPPSWSDPHDAPQPGDRCNCCRQGRWWAEIEDPLGWRCGTCHPPAVTLGLRQVRT